MKHLNLQLARYQFIGKNDCTKEKNKDEQCISNKITILWKNHNGFD